MTKLFIIYTGGTIGMVNDPLTGALKPFDFELITKQVPELSRFDYEITAHSFNPLIDSSNMQPGIWIELVKLIESNYHKYDGFVILHGTDTMSYTASALSFMLSGLQKPVILTGSQLPIGEIRTDAKENLITALEIAAQKEHGESVIKEVCIFFDYKLMRGNRTTKSNSTKFEAFQSPNYPALAEAGVHIIYNQKAFIEAEEKGFEAYKTIDTNIALIKLYPGISRIFIESVLAATGLKALILETFGAGNASTEKWFLDCLKSASEKGIIIYNITQCIEGCVEQGRYETSTELKNIGVIPGSDSTTEAALAKIMFLLAQDLSIVEIKRLLQKSLRGEISNC